MRTVSATGHFGASGRVDRHASQFGVYPHTSPICPDNPTLYEAFYEALDVVFVDEADALQEVFDELFIRDEKLFGDRGHLIENAIRDIRNALHGLYEPGGHFLTHYLRRCDSALDATRCLFQLIKEHPKIQEYLRNRVSFKFQWEHKVRCSLKRWNPAAI